MNDEKKEVVTVEQVEKKEIPQVIERVGTIEIISEQKKTFFTSSDRCQ